jgi:hypothetical protein
MALGFGDSVDEHGKPVGILTLEAVEGAWKASKMPSGAIEP